jgi:hypothetical protein
MKQRVIADVRADKEARCLIRRLQRGKHLEKVIKRTPLAVHAQLHLLGFRKVGEHLRDVIRDFAFLDSRSPEDLAHENVEIEVCRDAQAISVFEDRMQEELRCRE